MRTFVVALALAALFVQPVAAATDPGIAYGYRAHSHDRRAFGPTCELYDPDQVGVLWHHRDASGTVRIYFAGRLTDRAGYWRTSKFREWC